jgi:transcriptional regulator with GAF, ATPase, and Fis domain
MFLKRFTISWDSMNKRWVMTSLVFLTVWLTGWLSNTWAQVNPATWSIIITVLAGMAAVLVYLSIRDHQRQQAAQVEIQRLTQRVEQANAQISGVLKLSYIYSQAKTESEMIEALLKLCIDLVGAQGASFVALDDRNQPLAAQTLGELPFPALTAWVEYLATPAIRQRCQLCHSYAQLNTSCPLLKAPFADVYGLFCLPLNSGNREWGVMNLYMPQVTQVDIETEAFLKTLLQDTALALESKRLRQREQEALPQMRLIQHRTDLSGLLAALLENIQSAFCADLAQIELHGNVAQRRVVLGEISRPVELLVDQTIESILRTGEAIQVDASSQSQRPSGPAYSLLGVPLFSRQRLVIGALLVVTSESLHQLTHQISLLHAFAAQVELISENADLLAEIEYRGKSAEGKVRHPFFKGLREDV